MSGFSKLLRVLCGFGIAMIVRGMGVLASDELTANFPDVAACFGGMKQYGLHVLEKPHDFDSSVRSGRSVQLVLQSPESELIELPGSRDFAAGRKVQPRSIACLYLSGRSPTKDDWLRLHQLSNLNSIRIVDCPLADDDFLELAAFSELEDLRVNGAVIGQQAIRALAKSPRLKRLSFGRYVISPVGRHPRPSLDSCQLDSAAIDELLKLERLEALNLSRIQLTRMQLEAICRLPRMEELDVRDCGLTDVSLRVLYGAKSLRKLWLRDQVTLYDDDSGIVPCRCEVTQRGAMDFIAQNPKCKLFYFYDFVLNDVTSQAEFEERLSHWKRKSNKYDGYHLDFRKPLITEEGLSWIVRVPDIVGIDLSGHEITDAGIDSIRQFKSLRELRIYETRISAEGLQMLKDLPHLEELWIDAAQFQRKPARIALKSLAPGTRIVVIADETQREAALDFATEFKEQIINVFTPCQP